MKLILTGASGFVGSEVLSQALSHPSITSIIALSRKPLAEPHTSNQKLKVVLLDDFSSYKPSVLEQLSGADTCIWFVSFPKNPTSPQDLVNLLTTASTFLFTYMLQ